MKRSNETEKFDSLQKSSWLELWFLGSLFVIVITSLMYLQNLQSDSHAEVLGQTDPTGIEKSSNDFTRNQTPALGL